MMYYINIWHDMISTGTGCLFRTDSKFDFFQNIPEFIDLYQVREFRVSKYKDRVTLSFTPDQQTNKHLWSAWIRHPFTMKPESLEYYKVHPNMNYRKAIQL